MAPTYATGPRPYTQVVADFNGDGIPDLAVFTLAPPGQSDAGVSILLANRDGTFQPAKSYATGTNAGVGAVGDFNGDGIPDLVAADGGKYPDYQATVSVLLGNGDGTFQAPGGRYAAGKFFFSLVVGDFNGDGHLDVVVANDVQNFTGSNTVSVFLGNGDGTFQAPQSSDAGLGFWGMVAGDFNGDGHLDLAAPGGFGVTILLGNGDGTFQAPQNYPVGDQVTYSVAVGDFNGDGIPDLAVAHYSGTVIILQGNGDGTFHPTGVRYAVGGRAWSLVVGDFNGDGFPDLAAITGGFGVSILLGNGDGTFQAARN